MRRRAEGKTQLPSAAEVKDPIGRLILAKISTRGPINIIERRLLTFYETVEEREKS